MMADPTPSEQVQIDQLRPDPANPRRISDDELDALERSIRQFGFVEPVIARREDATVIGGHQRLLAARRLGLASVPVIWLDVSAQQARLLGLALNRISGSWDDALLARLLAELQSVPELDLSLSGFDEAELKELLRSLETREKREREENFDLDEALEEARRTPRTKAGDLWALGPHRLLCGDSTAPEDVWPISPGYADRPSRARRQRSRSPRLRVPHVGRGYVLRPQLSRPHPTPRQSRRQHPRGPAARTPLVRRKEHDPSVAPSGLPGVARAFRGRRRGSTQLASRRSIEPVARPSGTTRRHTP
jgi:hypothetical protein